MVINLANASMYPVINNSCDVTVPKEDNNDTTRNNE